MKITKKSVQAAKAVRNKPIKAAEDPMETELMFEVEDVVDLVAEVTGKDVEIAIDDETDVATLTVGEDEYEIDVSDAEVLEEAPEAEKSTEPVVESRILRGRKAVNASAGKIVRSVKKR